MFPHIPGDHRHLYSMVVCLEFLIPELKLWSLHLVHVVCDAIAPVRELAESDWASEITKTFCCVDVDVMSTVLQPLWFCIESQN